VAQGVLLLAVRSKPDESVSLAEPSIVQDNFGAADRLIALREKLVEGVVVDLWGQVTDPDGRVWLTRLQPGAVVVELESDGRIAVGNDLASEAVHGQNRAMVAVKVDESVACWLASEFVGHHLDGDDAVLPELRHGLTKEGFVHVGLEATDPKSAYARHPA
jgi:hypothetical protein